MPQDKKTVNAVRQVLMNELGLTRESIRAEVRGIVTQVVEAEFHKIQANGILQDIVAKAVNKFYQQGNRSSWQGVKAYLETAIRDATREYVAKHIKNNITFTHARKKKEIVKE